MWGGGKNTEVGRGKDRKVNFLKVSGDQAWGRSVVTREGGGSNGFTATLGAVPRYRFQEQRKGPGSRLRKRAGHRGQVR